MLTKSFGSFLDEFHCSSGTEMSQGFELFSFHLIVGDEEPLNFMQEIVIQITKKADVRVITGVCGNGD